MASTPDGPPESIVLANFLGIRNTVSEERLALGEMSSAVNVDIDDAGQLRRRRGREQLDTSNYHSLRRLGDKVLVVKDGVLGTLGTDYTHTTIAAVGSDPLSYVRVGDIIYYSSRSTSGKIVDGARGDWGTLDGGGQWVSPVQTPTTTLGAISGTQLHAPPLATELAHYKGRIYLASGRVIWATELYLYDVVERTRNFIMLPDDITMLQPVEDGIYVGTERQLLFLAGTLSAGMPMTVVAESPVIPGSAVEVPASRVLPPTQQGGAAEGTVVMLLTGGGVCVGLDGGQVINMTQGRVDFPEAQRAAALYREDQGANSYLFVANSGGSPASNSRIGDYADAEIRRASQGG